MARGFRLVKGARFPNRGAPPPGLSFILRNGTKPPRDGTLQLLRHLETALPDEETALRLKLPRHNWQFEWEYDRLPGCGYGGHTGWLYIGYRTEQFPHRPVVKAATLLELAAKVASYYTGRPWAEHRAEMEADDVLHVLSEGATCE